MPSRRMRSAVAMLATRLPAITGSSPTAALIASARGTNAPSGTTPWTVGTGDSCQPTPTLIASTPAPASSDGEREDLLERRRSGQEVLAGQPEDQRERGPDRGADRPRQLDAEAPPPLRVAAPVVVAQVRQRREELVDEVALRAHDLDRVVAELAARGARPARTRRGPPTIPSSSSGARRLAVEAAGDGGRGDRLQPERLLERVAPRVEQLQRDQPALGVHRRRAPPRGPRARPPR